MIVIPPHAGREKMVMVVFFLDSRRRIVQILTAVLFLVSRPKTLDFYTLHHER
jgi:hypothetical protein